MNNKTSNEFKEDALEFQRLLGLKESFAVGEDGKAPLAIRALRGLQYVYSRIPNPSEFDAVILDGLHVEFSMRSKLMAGHALRTAFGIDKPTTKHSPSGRKRRRS